MAQLVFVHGVATRDTAQYKQSIKSRDQLFREVLFEGHKVTIHSPLWGQFVPAIEKTVFETDKGVGTYSLNIGAAPGMGGGLMGEAASTDSVSIGAVGKQDPTAALDAICSQIVDTVGGNRELEPEELQAFRKAVELICANQEASVFVGEASTRSIAEQLNADAPAAFGIGSVIRDAIAAVTDRVRNTASTLGFGAIRESLSPALGLFIGDVFVYLSEGENRQRIRGEIRAALLKAYEGAKADKGPLVIVGHSMGGVILVDMLTDPAAAGLPADFSVDALLTVGSQPGFFAALDLLANNSPTNAKRRRPDCVKDWFNVFDPIDPLAFRSDMIYQGAVDLAFNSVAGLTQAHSKYFQRPQFYARTRKRLRDLGIL